MSNFRWNALGNIGVGLRDDIGCYRARRGQLELKLAHNQLNRLRIVRPRLESQVLPIFL